MMILLTLLKRLNFSIRFIYLNDWTFPR